MTEKLYTLTEDQRERVLDALDNGPLFQEVATLPAVQTSVVPSEMELMLVLDHTVRTDDIEFSDDEEAVRACEVFAKALRIYLSTGNKRSQPKHEAQVFLESKMRDHGYREQSEVGEAYTDEMIEKLFDSWWESDGQFVRSGGTSYSRVFAYEAFAFVLRNHATPPPSNGAKVREAVESIKIADKLIRFESDEPQWVTMMKVLEALQKALAALSQEVGK